MDHPNTKLEVFAMPTIYFLFTLVAGFSQHMVVTEFSSYNACHQAEMKLNCLDGIWWAKCFPKGDVTETKNSQ